MPDTSPDLYGDIARRLLAEARGAGGAPASPALPELPPVDLPGMGAAAAPSPPEMLPAPAMPSLAMPTPAHMPMPSPHALPSLPAMPNSLMPGSPMPSMPSMPQSVLPGLPGLAIPGAPSSLAPTIPAMPAAMPVPASPTDPMPGIRAFVESIRAGQPGVTPSSTMASPAAPAASAGWPVASGARPFDVAAIRAQFPILREQVHGRPLIWLDNAATTQKPQSVIDAIATYYRRDNSNIHRGAHTLAARSTDAFENARQIVAQYLGAGSPKEIVFVRGTTEAINLVAQTYGRTVLQPGDEIVLSVLEHHANIVPWQMIAREQGAVLRVAPVNDRGEILLEAYQALLNPRTRLVALTHASNSLGTILPIEAMIAMAKRYGARVLIDGAQTVAHLPVNVQSLDSDFYVFSGHKVFAPTGIGVLYAKEELLEMLPPWQGGGNMIRNVTFEETTYSDAPAKFEAGTPSIADAVGLGAALRYVSQLGLPQIARYEEELLHYATEKLRGIPGLRLIGTARNKVGVISFVLHDKPTEEVGRQLDQCGIAVRAGHHCAQPSLRRFGLESTVRPSLSIYNTREEIDHLAAAVKRIARL